MCSFLSAKRAGVSRCVQRFSGARTALVSLPTLFVTCIPAADSLSPHVQPTSRGVAVVTDTVGSSDQQTVTWAVPDNLMPGSYQWRVQSKSQDGVVSVNDTGRGFIVSAVDLAWGVTDWSPCNVTCGQVRAVHSFPYPPPIPPHLIGVGKVC